jgi:hypothetical protein
MFDFESILRENFNGVLALWEGGCGNEPGTV